MKYTVKMTVAGEGFYHTMNFTVDAADAVAAVVAANAQLTATLKMDGLTVVKVYTAKGVNAEDMK